MLTYVPIARRFFTDQSLTKILTLATPCISEICIKIKINLNLYFHTSLCCLKRFYEGLKGLHKTFWDTTKKCENKSFICHIQEMVVFGLLCNSFYMLKIERSVWPGQILYNWSFAFWISQLHSLTMFLYSMETC